MLCSVSTCPLISKHSGNMTYMNNAYKVHVYLSEAVT